MIAVQGLLAQVASSLSIIIVCRTYGKCQTGMETYHLCNTIIQENMSFLWNRHRLAMLP